jgi:aerobic-type carbon monoxide dehydrogenase small subunit (CoxS/CutS family)
MPEITVTVNGERRSAETDVRTTLADFVRHRLGLTGTHLGCEHGVCGACTILLDGAAIRSCLMLAVQADGHHLETIEGLADGDHLNPLQEAFHRNHALQCGFCTSGFLMSVTAALRDGPVSTEAEAREVLSGNICRCTGYAGMIRAVLEVSGTAEPAPRPADEEPVEEEPAEETEPAPPTANPMGDA